MIYTCCYVSPLGRMIMTSDGRSLTGLWFEGQRHAPRVDTGERSLPVFRDACRWLENYFAGLDPGPAPALELRGTPFRLRVWNRLREIPRGQTVSYSELCALLGEGSPRAVGQAVSRNPIAVIIPCHRVVGADGSLTGYAAGTDKKVRLLALEGALPAP